MPLPCGFLEAGRDLMSLQLRDGFADVIVPQLLLYVPSCFFTAYPGFNRLKEPPNTQEALDISYYCLSLHFILLSFLILSSILCLSRFVRYK